MVAETVNFSVSGEFVTNHARDLVMEDKASDALRFLTDSLNGMTIDIAVSILKGEMKLTGVNDLFIEDDDISGTDYKEQLDWMYGRLIRHNGAYYTPYAHVNRFDPADLKYQENSFSSRAMRYADDPQNDIALPATIKQENGMMSHEILFKKAHDIPFWINIPHDVDINLMMEQHFAYLEKRGYVSEEEVERENCKVLILQQNRNVFDGEMYEFDFGENIGVRKIPMGPLLKWATRRSEKSPRSNMWVSVSEIGIKMAMDDPDHTDWMIGAGIDLDEYNNDNFRNKQYELMREIQQKELGYNVTVLLEGKNACGLIVYAQPNKPVLPGSIAIIPNAGVDYMDAMYTAEAVITERGGAMSHLSVNGLDLDKYLVRVEDARTKIKEGSMVTIKDGELELDMEAW